MFIVFHIFLFVYEYEVDYKTVFPAMPLCPRKRRAQTIYVGYQEALHLRYSPGGKRLISARVLT